MAFISLIILMKGIVLLLLQAFAVVLCGQCPSVKLSDKELDNACKGKLCFVKVFAPWCGHCKHLAPVWEDLAQEKCNQTNIVIAEIDGAQYSDIMMRFNLRGFPSILLFENGYYMEYANERTLSGFQAFLKDHSVSEKHLIPPPPTKISKYISIAKQSMDMLVDILDKVLGKVGMEGIPYYLKIAMIIFVMMLPTIFLLTILICMKPKEIHKTQVKEEVKEPSKKESDDKHKPKND
jgi:protein disulfide-isomerase-like protein